MSKPTRTQMLPQRQVTPAVRYIAATLSIAAGGYLLLATVFIYQTMQDRAHGWYINELPSRPVARMVAYATVAFALQFIFAWLLMPRVASGSAEGARIEKFWATYATR